MLIKRKDFLQVGSLATASLLMPRFLKAFERPAMVPPGNKAVVIIQLSGGNDGLNTVIPVRNDIYYKSRPRLGITAEKALSLTDEAGLHPALTSVKQLFDTGSAAIMNNVGYPNPDRSHFRSMDIWQSAANSNEYLNTGWIGRWLDAQCKGCDHPTQAVELDDLLSLALKGSKNNGVAFRDPAKLAANTGSRFYRDLVAAHQPAEQPVDYLYKTLGNTLSSAQYIHEQSKRFRSQHQYPSTRLGKDLKTIAGLIFSDINTKVYYVSLGSFDTHVNQEQQQQRLFLELNAALKSFTGELEANNRFGDVLITTFSEFGRRVAQNASGGTDHGTANNMFFLSGGLKKKGLLNALPNLEDLDQGDLKHTIDFKDVYATILNKWLQADDTAILGAKHRYLDFI
ncbi:MAG: DUF1501 domain-containing protein [Ferruginibacter sp.]|nr:DUF1501 domain-containing protein [Ferruginibacter sp.]